MRQKCCPEACPEPQVSVHLGTQAMFAPGKKGVICPGVSRLPGSAGGAGSPLTADCSGDLPLPWLPGLSSSRGHERNSSFSLISAAFSFFENPTSHI